MAVFEIPLIASPQTFSITLVGATYTMSLNYRKANAGVLDAPTGADPNVAGAVIDTNNLDNWVLDISDSAGNPMIFGIPLIPGIDLLGQYAYLNIGGQLTVAVSGDPVAVPDYAGLGTSSKMLFTTP